MVGDDDVFVTRSLGIMPKTTEQRLIVCSSKSEAEVTNNRRVCSRYCSIEAYYLQTQASCSISETAELLVTYCMAVGLTSGFSVCMKTGALDDTLSG